MAIKQRHQLLDDQAANGEGDAVEVFGSTVFTLWVTTPSDLDTGGGDTLTVTLHVSHDGTTFEPHSTLTLSESDLTQDGSDRFIGSVSVDGEALHTVKAVVTNFNDASDSGTTPVADLDIDAYLTIVEQ